MVNYCIHYIPKIPNILASLHQLLSKEAKWEWTSKQEQAWKESKEQLNSPKVLVDFDPNKAVIVACDGSLYGLRAVLPHIMEDGSERPIAIVSRTLTRAEKNIIPKLTRRHWQWFLEWKNFTNFYMEGRSHYIQSQTTLRIF